MEPNIQAQIKQYDSYLQQWCAGYEDYAKSVGLSYTSLSVLEAIHALPDCTQKQLCQLCFLPKQTVNAVVTSFYKKGWAWKRCRRIAGTRPSTSPNRGSQKPSAFWPVSRRVGEWPWRRCPKRSGGCCCPLRSATSPAATRC